MPTRLRRNDAISIIRRKTAFSKEQVEKLQVSLNGGKISFPFFKEIVEMMRCRAGRSSFALSNKAEWEYIERRLHETDLPATKFAEYFCTDTQTAAEIRAKLMKPNTSAAQVKQFIADCLNMQAEQLDENTRINLMLPADFQDYNFYLIVLSWCRQRFGKTPDQNLISKGTVRDLITFFSDE